MLAGMRNLSLVKRLGLVFFVSTGLALACMFFSFSTIVLYFSQRSFTQELASVIQVIASTSRAALAFSDVEAGKRVLGALQHKQHIEYVALLDRKGSYAVDQGGFGSNADARTIALDLAQEQRDSGIASNRVRWSWEHLAMTEPVILDGEVLGDVVAVVELRALYHQIFLLICIAAGVTITIAVGAFLFLFKLRSWVIEPLRTLKSLTQEVSVTKDFSARIELTKDEELNQLFEAFNNMLSQIGERDKSLLFAKERAEQADRTKSMFVASVSHELRTPLHTIIGLAEEVLESRLENSQQELMRSLVMAGNSLLFIINDILDFSKIEAGKLTLEIAPFELHTLVERLNGMFKVPAEKKSLTLSVELGELVSPAVSGDIHRIMQVLINLVGNAVKFTPSGGSIRVQVRVYRGERSSPSMLHFSVSDTGVGIPADKLQAIFQAFTQIRSPDEVIQGTGLGLAISSKLVQMMNGWIWVDSSPGVGSTFHFVVDCPPIKEGTMMHSRSPVDTQQSDTRAIGNTSEASQSVILVVEDNVTNQKLAQRLLEKAGYKVLVANNGREAVEAYRQTRIDVILMDINMPIMDGLEATRVIREDERSTGRRVPIIALTASVAHDESNVCFQAGMDAFVTKPFSRGTLLQLVAERIEESRCQSLTH